MIYEAIHAALSPAVGHTGFDGPILNGLVPQGSYHHYLHHRFFECNYGTEVINLDALFGTFRDGHSRGNKLPGEHQN